MSSGLKFLIGTNDPRDLVIEAHMKILEREAFFLFCDQLDSGALELIKVCFSVETAFEEKKKLDRDDAGAFILKATLISELDE
jgi:hypothetical protein